MKTLLNPLIISAFIVIMLLGSLAQLMYGSSQSSKWHYIIQRYYMIVYLPRGMYIDLRVGLSGMLPPRNYSGTWITWYKNGNLQSKVKINKGEEMANVWWNEDATLYKKEYYDSKGYLQKREHFKNNKLIESISNALTIFWYENGVKKSEEYYKDHKLYGLRIYWHKDGTLNKKEYYDSKGNFLKRMLFEKGQLVKTEVVE
ncbi:MAG: hypothetical protein COA79_26415 [Planctomycetota bacterium]|nr:MAG: hypothetical protein COA79_26415 [Planctomycetota bacterium]